MVSLRLSDPAVAMPVAAMPVAAIVDPNCPNYSCPPMKPVPVLEAKGVGFVALLLAKVPRSTLLPDHPTIDHLVPAID